MSIAETLLVDDAEVSCLTSLNGRLSLLSKLKFLSQAEKKIFSHGDVIN